MLFTSLIGKPPDDTLPLPYFGLRWVETSASCTSAPPFGGDTIDILQSNRSNDFDGFFQRNNCWVFTGIVIYLHKQIDNAFDNADRNINFFLDQHYLFSLCRPWPGDMLITCLSLIFL